MTPAFQDSTLTVYQGNALEVLKALPDESVNCCVTSPPYWNLRSYLPKDHPLKGDEIGLEKTPEEYVAKMVTLFHEVRRVLTVDGSCWLNLGDSYAASGRGGGGGSIQDGDVGTCIGKENSRRKPVSGYKPKDLVGVPWMVAFALRSDGWYLRQDIIWAKPNCMPESVEDRCTRSHEYVFLLSKSERYHFDYKSIMVKASESFSNDSRWNTGSTDLNIKDGYEKAGAQNPKRPHRMFDKQRGHSRRHDGFNDRWDQMEREHQMLTARRRDVWWIAPANCDDAHFAVMPHELARLCVLAGSRPGDVVLDPFGGSGTTGAVAIELGRKATLIELNPEYLPLIEKRTHVTPGLPL